jgi:hypothetical protein
MCQKPKSQYKVVFSAETAYNFECKLHIGTQGATGKGLIEKQVQILYGPATVTGEVLNETPLAVNTGIQLGRC